MKTKIFPILFILFIFLVPFRYAVLEPTSSNTINLLCMLATVFGTLIFFLVSMGDGRRDEVKVKSNSNAHNRSNKMAA
jgi:uncharacterized membrane protein